ncbi:UNVERIFIED_CONTAM: hypothetical protein K2H54_011187 [Gekko kuhli]
MILELLLDGIHNDALYSQHHVLHLSPDLFSLSSELPAETFNFSVLHGMDALWVILEVASVVPLGTIVCKPLEPQICSQIVIIGATVVHCSGTVPSAAVEGTSPSSPIITAAVQEVEEGKRES